MSPLKEFSLEGRVAIVTGAGRGLGEAMSKALAQAGADLVIAELDESTGENTAHDIEKLGRKAVSLKIDVTSADDIQRLTETTIKEFGKIDILVNNAGYSKGGDYLPQDLPRELWDKVIDINLNGVFLCSQTIGKQMIAQKRGKIINIASINAFVVNKITGKLPFAYCVSKAGVVMLTKVLATAWAKHNINVNSIAPTYFETPMSDLGPVRTKEIEEMTPMGRFGKPEELDGTIVYLASDASDFVTGHTLVVDGGYTLW